MPRYAAGSLLIDTLDPLRISTRFVVCGHDTLRPPAANPGDVPPVDRADARRLPPPDGGGDGSRGAGSHPPSQSPGAPAESRGRAEAGPRPGRPPAPAAGLLPDVRPAHVP